MELSHKLIEDFIKAYKNDYGEDLTYEQAHEIAHRLVNIFLILEEADRKQKEEEQGIELLSEDDELEESSNTVSG